MISQKKQEQKMEVDEIIEKDEVLHFKYDILSKIGEGSFGQVYKALNRNSKKQVALKIQLKPSYKNKSHLLLQMNAYSKLNQIQGVPKIYHCGKWKHGFYLEMELLSSNLSEELDKNYTITEINLLAVQILQILKRIHSKGIIHRDLKPQNIMRNSSGSLVIVDFGLARIISTDNEISESSSSNYKVGFIGTPRFASIAAHNCKKQFPKDDIESMLYILAFLYHKKAPWLNISSEKSGRLEKIQKIKMHFAQSWMAQSGPAIAEAYNYISSLSQEVKVQYSFLLNCFYQRKFSINEKPPITILEKRRKSHYHKINSRADYPEIHIHYVERDGANKKQLKEYSSKKTYGTIESYYIDLLTQKIFTDVFWEGSETETDEKNDRILLNESLHFQNPFQSFV